MGTYVCVWLAWLFSHSFPNVNWVYLVFKLKALKGDPSVTAVCGHLTRIQQKSFSLRGFPIHSSVRVGQGKPRNSFKAKGLLKGCNCTWYSRKVVLEKLHLKSIVIWQTCHCILKSRCFELSYSSCCNWQYADDLSKLGFCIWLHRTRSSVVWADWKLCSLLNGLYDFFKVCSEIVIWMLLRNHLLCGIQLVILHVNMTELTGEEAGGMAVCTLICFPRFVLLEMNQSQEKNVSEE